MIWDTLTSTQLQKLDKNIPVLLVLAATEQHGSHLPLATDRLIGEHFAHALNKEIPEQVLVLPAVSIGCSDHHMGFSGSLSLSHEHFSGQVQDIVKSVIFHGFKNIILMNAHGGNQAIGQVITEQLGYRFPDKNFVFATWWQIASAELKNISETTPGGTGHAGEFETSLMLLINPDLVDKNQIMKKHNTPTFTWAEGDMMNAPKAYFYRTVDKMTPNGVFGEPGSASAAKGEKITRCVVAALQKIVLDLFGSKTTSKRV